MRSEFIAWGSGGWTRVRFVCRGAARRVASTRGASLIPCHADLRLGRVACVACVALCHGDCCWAGRVGGAVPWGSASRARRACTVGAAVPWGLLPGRSRGWRCAVGICVSGVSRVWRVWRCAMGIAAGQVVWVALCRGDLRLGRVARGVCGAVPWGLLLGRSRGWRCAVGICVSGVSRVWRVWRCVSGASRVWRCAMGIAAGRVAWVPLCHGDCWWACRVGGAVPWGLLGACRVGGGVPWGLLLGVSPVWRCAMGIATGRVAWVALCHGDCCWACRVGGAVPWGLLLGVSRGWRCAMGIAAGRVVGEALCHGDCWWACRVDGAVCWGLLTRASSGWRRVLGIADQGVVWVAPCLGGC